MGDRGRSAKSAGDGIACFRIAVQGGKGIHACGAGAAIRDDAEWDELLPEIAVPIRAAEAVQMSNGKERGAAAAVGGAIAAAAGDDSKLSAINALLDERIRPYLAGDGGWLEVLELTDETLTIRYEGACGSCPSSLTGTLMAIENLIRDEIDPDLSVVAV